MSFIRNPKLQQCRYNSKTNCECFVDLCVHYYLLRCVHRLTPRCLCWMVCDQQYMASVSCYQSCVYFQDAHLSQNTPMLEYIPQTKNTNIQFMQFTSNQQIISLNSIVIMKISLQYLGSNFIQQHPIQHIVPDKGLDKPTH